jgi:hypothetical protein
VHSPRRLALLVALAAAMLIAAFAPPAMAAGPQQYHGAQTHPFWSGVPVSDYDKELDLLAQAGSDSVRVDLSWSSLETDGKGQINDWYIKRVDTFMEHARARGLKVLATFWTTPCWASTAPESLKQGCQGAWWDRGVHLYPPADPTDYANAAAYAAQRWGSDLIGLEVWNEPNQDDFLKGADPVGEYAKIVKAAYGPIKAVAPTLPVIVGAVAHSDGEWLTKMWSKGVSGYYDGISIHPYNEWRDPNDAWQPQWKAYSYLSGVKWVRELMVARGEADKGLWLTEFGFSSCTDGSKECVSAAKQAAFTKESFKIAAGWNYVKGAWVYNLRNQTDNGDRLSQYGLVNADFSRKPAYDAFADALHTYYGAGATAQPDANATTGTTGSPAPGSSGSGSGSSSTSGRGSSTPVSGGSVTVDGGATTSILPTSNGYTKIALKCRAKKGKRCKGTLRLRSAKPVAGPVSSAASKVGERRFSIKNGTTVVRVRLSQSARAQVQRIGHLRVAATIVGNAKGKATTKRSFVLSRI